VRHFLGRLVDVGRIVSWQLDDQAGEELLPHRHFACGPGRRKSGRRPTRCRRSETHHHPDRIEVGEQRRIGVHRCLDTSQGNDRQDRYKYDLLQDGCRVSSGTISDVRNDFFAIAPRQESADNAAHNYHLMKGCHGYVVG